MNITQTKCLCKSGRFSYRFSNIDLILIGYFFLFLSPINEFFNCYLQNNFDLYTHVVLSRLQVYWTT